MPGTVGVRLCLRFIVKSVKSNVSRGRKWLNEVNNMEKWNSSPLRHCRPALNAAVLRDLRPLRHSPEFVKGQTNIMLYQTTDAELIGSESGFGQRVIESIDRRATVHSKMGASSELA
jgi:hypothetical protein